MKQTATTNAATASHWEKVATTAATAATEAAAAIRTTWNPVEIEAHLHAAEAAATAAAEAAAEAMTAAAAEAAEAAAAAYTAAKWGANLSRYEGAYNRRDNDPDGYAAALQTAARSIASSVIAKTIDPQRRDAVKRDSVSNSGYSAAMVALRREVVADCTHLDNLHTAEAAAFGARVHHKKDGDTVIMRYVVDDTAAAVMDGMELDRLGDGIDLVNEAAAAILEQSTAHATTAPGWMEASYTMRRIKRRVLIKSSDTAAWEDIDTSPVREAFRAVRRAVADSRAVVADPRSKYCYIEDLATAPDDSSTLEVVYRRLHKFADIGGYAHTGHAGRDGADCGGLYSVDMEAYMDYNAIMERLKLTAAQADYIRLRMEGCGSAAIATYLGVSEGRVYNIAKAIRTKCEKIGFTPSMWKEMTEA